MKFKIGCWGLVLPLATVACGTDDGAGEGGGVVFDDGGAQGPSAGGPASMPGAPGGPGEVVVEPPETVPSECGVDGLKLDGLMYSPGGAVLPFPCEPFHPTTNNPYAVRCVDAWSWYDSGFPGDEYCILPPTPGKGIQIGVHPQGLAWYDQVSTGDLSGYQNVPQEFLLASGGEEERNYVSSGTNQARQNFYRAYSRMRAGSHHMIVAGRAAEGAQREVWGPGSVTVALQGLSLPGAQRPDENVPKSLDKPAEDQGLFTGLPPDQDIVFNMHHFNAGEETILKEAWQNLWWEDDATVPIVPIFGLSFDQVRGTFAEPGETVDAHYSWVIKEETRLVQLFGHRHAWTGNFSAWLTKPDGTEEVLYQSFDWFDQPTYRYDSVTDNPAPAPERLVDGGYSGVRMLQPGEELHFNCHMQYTNERAELTGAPLPSANGPLRFANQAFTAEMCILFGSTAEKGLGLPMIDERPVPDFAAME